MFERFTERARQAVVIAQEEARILKHGHIGVEHLLLGIARGESLAADVLADAGLDHAVLRDRVLEQFPSESGRELTGQIPFTRAAKTALERALLEALSLGHSYIVPPHVLLGVIHEESKIRTLDAIDVASCRDGAVAAANTEMAQVRQRRRRRSTAAREQQAAGRVAEAVPTHRDRPASVDELGRAALAEVLAERLRGIRVRSVSQAAGADTDGEAVLVHLHAPWGAGKSSLLRLLDRELSRPDDDRTPPWTVVHFSAWQHQRVAPPWWWLLAAIRRDGMRALRARSGWGAVRFWLADVRWRMWNARSVLGALLVVSALAFVTWQTNVFGLDDRSLAGLRAAALAVAALVGLAITVSGAVRGIGRWLAFGPAPPGARILQRSQDPMRASQRRFRFLVRALRGPIAIFVDDLDRCRAEYVVELLEGIQTLFLDQPVVFVVAADRDWVCQSYVQVYKDFEAAAGDAGRPLGHLFLEKTFQLSLEVPPPPPEVHTTYWRGLVRGRDATPAATADASAPAHRVLALTQERRFARLDSEAAIVAALDGGADSAAEHEAMLRAAMRRLGSADLQRDLEHALEPFAHLVEPNPRGMKRLVNAYGVERALLLRTGQRHDDDTRQLSILWMIVKLRWPLLAAAVEQRPELADALSGAASPSATPAPDHLRDLCQSAAVRDAFAGAGVNVRLDAEAVRALTGRVSSRAAQSVGA